MPLDRDDMMEAFEREGYTAIPHPYDNNWIAMPLHYKNAARPLAEANGWEWIPMGWKPKNPKPKTV